MLPGDAVARRRRQVEQVVTQVDDEATHGTAQLIEALFVHALDEDLRLLRRGQPDHAVRVQGFDERIGQGVVGLHLHLARAAAIDGAGDRQLGLVVTVQSGYHEVNRQTLRRDGRQRLLGLEAERPLPGDADGAGKSQPVRHAHVGGQGPRVIAHAYPCLSPGSRHLAATRASPVRGAVRKPFRREYTAEPQRPKPGAAASPSPVPHCGNGAVGSGAWRTGRSSCRRTGWRCCRTSSTSPTCGSLSAFLRERRGAGAEIYPPPGRIFHAFSCTPPQAVKVVLLGQDPYHNPGQAEGLCFSVAPGVAIPPSLANIYRELHDDLGIPPPPHGSLASWAGQGVLLLNAVLTVERNQPGCHQGRGWERFTDRVGGTAQRDGAPARVPAVGGTGTEERPGDRCDAPLRPACSAPVSPERTPWLLRMPALQHRQPLPRGAGCRAGRLASAGALTRRDQPAVGSAVRVAPVLVRTGVSCASAGANAATTRSPSPRRSTRRNLRFGRRRWPGSGYRHMPARVRGPHPPRTRRADVSPARGNAGAR
jgi:uracil-DNA glycosylase